MNKITPGQSPSRCAGRRAPLGAARALRRTFPRSVLRVHRCSASMHSVALLNIKKSNIKPQKSTKSANMIPKTSIHNFLRKFSAGNLFLCPTPFWIAFRDRGEFTFQFTFRISYSIFELTRLSGSNLKIFQTRKIPFLS